jgi:hypothetical protein
MPSLVRPPSTADFLPDRIPGNRSRQALLGRDAHREQSTNSYLLLADPFAAHLFAMVRRTALLP